MYHKEILPQYPVSICNKRMKCLLSSKKRHQIQNERTHLNSGEGIGQSPCKLMYLDLSSLDDSDTISVNGKK